MNSKIFSMAMGELNDKYVSEAMNYQGQHKKNRWIRYAAAAACLCLILAGVLPLTKRPPASPFVLTAYALAPDHSVEAVILKEGESVPVALFKTTSGLQGFVFSSQSETPDVPQSVSIMGSMVSNEIGEICDITLLDGNDYFYYVVGENEQAPFTFPWVVHSDDNTAVTMYEITIDASEQGYAARVSDVKTYDQVDAPDTHH